MRRVLIAITPKNFHDDEFFDIKDNLEDSKIGIDVKVSSSVHKANSILGKNVKTNILLKNIDVDDYDCFVFIGGTDTLAYDEKVIKLVKKANVRKKMLCAIDTGTRVLANAGVLKGKKATGWPTEEINMRIKGAIYTARSLESTGLIITAEGPSSTKQFTEEILNNIRCV